MLAGHDLLTCAIGIDSRSVSWRARMIERRLRNGAHPPVHARSYSAHKDTPVRRAYVVGIERSAAREHTRTNVAIFGSIFACLKVCSTCSLHTTCLLCAQHSKVIQHLTCTIALPVSKWARRGRKSLWRSHEMSATSDLCFVVMTHWWGEKAPAIVIDHD